jgi:hypothetical protein
MESYVIFPDGDMTLVIKNPNEFFANWPTAPSECQTMATNTSTKTADSAVGEEEEIELEIISPPPVTEVRFQVSSAHLILSSPYFRSSLTGPWKEAQALRDNQPVEMICPGWDTEAMLIFLQIAHAQPWELPETVETELLAKVAVVADYYGCQRLVQYYAERWIAKVDMQAAVEGKRDLALRLWISWFFVHHSNFTVYTSFIIQKAKSTITPLGLPIPSAIIGDHFDPTDRNMS